MAIKRPSQCDVGNDPEPGSTFQDSSTPLWGSALGALTLEVENAALTPFVRRLHGDTILWAGEHPESAMQLERCMVRNAVFLQQDTAGRAAEISSIQARLEALPLKTHALDAVVMHHALETTDDPRIALREATRVLMPGGRLLIVGYNPFSALGARRLYARVMPDALSGHRLVNPLRLLDWLALLGFELDVAPLYCGFTMPSSRLVQRFDLPRLQERESMCEDKASLPFGSLLVISAVKQAIPLRLQKAGKTGRRSLAPVAYPRVASWQRIKS